MDSGTAPDGPLEISNRMLCFRIWPKEYRAAEASHPSSRTPRCGFGAAKGNGSCCDDMVRCAHLGRHVNRGHSGPQTGFYDGDVHRSPGSDSGRYGGGSLSFADTAGLGFSGLFAHRGVRYCSPAELTGFFVIQKNAGNSSYCNGNN